MVDSLTCLSTEESLLEQGGKQSRGEYRNSLEGSRVRNQLLEVRRVLVNILRVTGWFLRQIE